MDAIITTIDLLRHGECADGHCYRGSTDVALTDVGWEQMVDSVDYLQRQHGLSIPTENDDHGTPWDAIISSPLRRCARFSEHLAEQYQLSMMAEERFKEIHFGDWEGQSIKAVWQQQAQAVQAWTDDPVRHPPPGGEPADVFVNRVKAALLDVLQQYAGQHLLLVSHGGVMRALLAHCLSMPVTELQRFDVPFACVSRIQIVYSDNQYFYRLISHNLISHLIVPPKS